MASGVRLHDVVDYLDQYLRVREIPDDPKAINGLQVENSGRVGGVVAAVDASQATIDGVIATLDPGRGTGFEGSSALAARACRNDSIPHPAGETTPQPRMKSRLKSTS